MKASKQWHQNVDKQTVRGVRVITLWDWFELEGPAENRGTKPCCARKPGKTDSS